MTMILKTNFVHASCVSGLSKKVSEIKVSGNIQIDVCLERMYDTTR